MRKQIRLPAIDYDQQHAFYLTLCTKDRLRWFEKHVELADECEERLIELAQDRSSDLFAWCIMPDHVHVLLRDAEPVQYIRLVKGAMSHTARKFLQELGLWQRSFFDRALRSDESVLEAARYTWTNPVRAGLVDNPGRYRWSGSLTWPHWRDEYTT